MRILTLATLLAALSASPVLAQTHGDPVALREHAVQAKPPMMSPKKPTIVTAAPAKTATSMTPEKTAISKACSAQADQQKLHGKAREKFRSKCKHDGGKG